MKKKNLRGIVIYVIAMCLLIIAFSYVGLSQYNKRLAYNNQINELKQQIASANKYTEELKAQSKYKESDEYIEKIAREQLSMVKPNEIVFIDENKN